MLWDKAPTRVQNTNKLKLFWLFPIYGLNDIRPDGEFFYIIVRFCVTSGSVESKSFSLFLTFLLFFTSLVHPRLHSSHLPILSSYFPILSSRFLIHSSHLTPSPLQDPRDGRCRNWPLCILGDIPSRWWSPSPFPGRPEAAAVETASLKCFRSAVERERPNSSKPPMARYFKLWPRNKSSPR